MNDEDDIMFIQEGQIGNRKRITRYNNTRMTYKTFDYEEEKNE